MFKIEPIYQKLACGGLGYPYTLYRITCSSSNTKSKYYTIRGDSEAEFVRKVAEAVPYRRKKNGYALWLKHFNDNVISAKEFYEKFLVKKEQKQISEAK